jgi:large subunit ribosomal protein L15
MRLYELKPARGSRHKKKIVGRGAGSGHGKTSTRGNKGQNSRAGGGVRLGFEGGQMPLIRRIPKRGFTKKSRKEYVIVNVEVLEKIFNDNDTVTPEILIKKKIISGRLPLKVLGNGAISKKLTVKASVFSESAKKKIIEAKGTVEIIKNQKADKKHKKAS